MMQTLNPYTTTSTAKTAEIMARYRPIAPKPESPETGETQKIRQSPYLRSVWSNLQARPTRTRKRGRTSLAPPPPPSSSVKCARACCLQGLSPPFHITNSPAKNLSIQGFAHCPTQLCPISSFATATTTHATLVTRPLLPCPSFLSVTTLEENHSNVIDLNKEVEIPKEKDLLALLQKPITNTTTNVIYPRPIRLVGSGISIRGVKEESGSINELQVLKKADEVQEELESECLPVVISDSNNKVRLVNSAYKEMVGQPECPWLESMVINGGDACKRICGEVVLQFLDDPDVGALVSSSNGFSCWARIEWGTNGKKKSVEVFCEAMRLFCESKDYMFAWRFHTREASGSASNV